MENTIDAIDKRILNLLQADGKMKIKEIAAALKMTTTPVFERIKKLEKEGFIKSYSANVNRQKLGYSLLAFCSVTLEKHEQNGLEKFIEEVQDIPEVIECYHIAGMFDYLLKVCIKDMNDYQKFVTQKLSTLSNIGKIQSSFVMTEIKNEQVLKIDV